jgi:hypothetical protein
LLAVDWIRRQELIFEISILKPSLMKISMLHTKLWFSDMRYLSCKDIFLFSQTLPYIAFIKIWRGWR